MSDIQPTSGPEQAALTGVDDQSGIDAFLQEPAVPGKDSLSIGQVLEIRRLRKLNPDATQAQIAAVVGCSTSSVCRWLQLDITDDEADNVLGHNALRAALVLVRKLESGDERVSLDAAKTVLKARKMLDGEQVVKVGIQVVLGAPANITAFAPPE